MAKWSSGDSTHDCTVDKNCTLEKSPSLPFDTASYT